MPYDNEISKEGAENLTDALNCNHVIEYIYLSGNHISHLLNNKIKLILDDPNMKAIPAEMLIRKKGQGDGNTSWITPHRLPVNNMTGILPNIFRYFNYSPYIKSAKS